MSLEEEIAIYQFAQGVHPDSLLLDSFRQLDEESQHWRFFDLFHWVSGLETIPSDVEQAIIEGSFDPSYTPYVSVKPYGPKLRSLTLPEGDLFEDYKFLLYLVKTTYQRRFNIDRENPAAWWCQDLSASEVVQGILTRYEELVEELYNSPSYRSEFSSIAKLWHEYTLLREGKKQEAHSGKERSGFLTYDELVEEYVILANEPGKYINPMSILRGSLEKGLAKRYKLDRNLIHRIASAVIDRHLRETYPTDL